MMKTTREQKILRGLNGRSRTDAFEAAKQIWLEPGSISVMAVIQVLRHGRRPLNRAAAAYSLQMLSDPRAIRALERTVSNRCENPGVRGNAAEGLAHFHRKASHQLLLKALQDSSRQVRFWCAFVLGEMRDRAALPRLTELKGTDHRVLKRWW